MAGSREVSSTIFYFENRDSFGKSVVYTDASTETHNFILYNNASCSRVIPRLDILDPRDTPGHRRRKSRIAVRAL